MRQPWYVTNHSDLYAVFFPTFVTVLHLTLECASIFLNNLELPKTIKIHREAKTRVYSMVNTTGPGSGANLLKSMDWRTYSPAY